MIKAKMKVMVGLLAVLLLLPAAAFAAEPFVTTEWLQANLSKVTVRRRPQGGGIQRRPYPRRHQRFLRRLGHQEGSASQRAARRRRSEGHPVGGRHRTHHEGRRGLEERDDAGAHRRDTGRLDPAVRRRGERGRPERGHREMGRGQEGPFEGRREAQGEALQGQVQQAVLREQGLRHGRPRQGRDCRRPARRSSTRARRSWTSCPRRAASRAP